MNIPSNEKYIIGLQIVLHDITNDKRRTESLAFLIKSLEDQLTQREKMNTALKIDLERLTARLNQREAEFSDLHERATKQKFSDADIKKIKYCLQCETTKLLTLVELLQKFFAQFQVQMNSAKHLMDRAICDEDYQKGNN